MVDPDLAGERSSSQLNAGGVRATWWQPVNVELCAATIAFFAEHREELAFRERGYLWLHGPGRWPAAAAHVPMQNRFGREVELLAPAEVRRRWPFIDQLGGIAGATFSPKDGLVDPNAVREHYRARARAAGAVFLDRLLVTGVRREGDRVTGVELRELDGGAAAAGGPGGRRRRRAGAHPRLRADGERRRALGVGRGRPDRGSRAVPRRAPPALRAGVPRRRPLAGAG